MLGVCLLRLRVMTPGDHFVDMLVGEWGGVSDACELFRTPVALVGCD